MTRYLMVITKFKVSHGSNMKAIKIVGMSAIV